MTLENLIKLSETTSLKDLVYQRDRFQDYYNVLKSKKDTKKDDLIFCQDNLFLYNNLIYIKNQSQQVQQ